MVLISVGVCGSLITSAGVRSVFIRTTILRTFLSEQAEVRPGQLACIAGRRPIQSRDDVSCLNLAATQPCRRTFIYPEHESNICRAWRLGAAFQHSARPRRPGHPPPLTKKLIRNQTTRHSLRIGILPGDERRCIPIFRMRAPHPH